MKRALHRLCRRYRFRCRIHLPGSGRTGRVFLLQSAGKGAERWTLRRRHTPGARQCQQTVEPLPEPDFQEVRYVSLRNRRRQPAQCHCTRSTCRYSHPRSRQACAAYRLECIRRPGGSRICCSRPRFAVYPRIGKSPCQSYRQRHCQTSVTGSLRSSTRSICHEPGYSGSCGNLHQSGIRKDETR